MHEPAELHAAWVWMVLPQLLRPNAACLHEASCSCQFILRALSPSLAMTFGLGRRSHRNTGSGIRRLDEGYLGRFVAKSPPPPRVARHLPRRGGGGDKNRKRPRRYLRRFPLGHATSRAIDQIVSVAGPRITEPIPDPPVSIEHGSGSMPARWGIFPDPYTILTGAQDSSSV